MTLDFPWYTHTFYWLYRVQHKWWCGYMVVLRRVTPCGISMPSSLTYSSPRTSSILGWLCANSFMVFTVQALKTCWLPPAPSSTSNIGNESPVGRQTTFWPDGLPGGVRGELGVQTAEVVYWSRWVPQRWWSHGWWSGGCSRNWCGETSGKTWGHFGGAASKSGSPVYFFSFYFLIY